jgi:hypothetical protein
LLFAQCCEYEGGRIVGNIVIWGMAHTNKFKKMGEWQVKIQGVNFDGMLSLLWFGIKTSDRP